MYVTHTACPLPPSLHQNCLPKAAGVYLPLESGETESQSPAWGQQEAGNVVWGSVLLCLRSGVGEPVCWHVLVVAQPGSGGDTAPLTDDALSSGATQACPKSRDILGVFLSPGMPSL